MNSTNKNIYEIIINDPNVPEDQKAKEKKYKEYIDNHKKNVIETWEELKKNNIISFIMINQIVLFIIFYFYL